VKGRTVRVRVEAGARLLPTITRWGCPWAFRNRPTLTVGTHPHPALAWAPRVDLRHWEGYTEPGELAAIREVMASYLHVCQDGVPSSPSGPSTF
jgi:hypothetical protein